MATELKMMRGSLVVRNGQKGTVTYMQGGAWTVVYAQRPSADECAEGPDRSAGWGSEGTLGGSPESAGWKIDPDPGAA